MTHGTITPAGWYDDGTGRQRWFDGSTWGAYVDAPAVVDPGTAPAQEEEQPVVVRRTRRSPYEPPAPDQDDSGSDMMVSRSWGLGLRAAKARQESGLTRNRTVAGDLPAWAPLPPGELSVDRSAGRPG